ncbi:MAG: Mur ligase domain-containing protein, partial [Prevotella sp.]|nr:Mur ligase domain-containing protein [Prevotella sp.]
MKLQDLLKNIDVTEIKGDIDTDVTGVFTDSRKSVSGSVFIALKGVQVDGHQYINNALDLGAKVIIHEEKIDTFVDGITYVNVMDGADAAGKIATHWYGDPSSKLKLVGVTGTNGKTTTATLLYEIFRELGYKAGLLSTVANYIDGTMYHATHTTPDPISLNDMLKKMVDAGCEYAFMEVSSHAIHQKRISGLKFEGGIFTNITQDHLDYHKTMA